MPLQYTKHQLQLASWLKDEKISFSLEKEFPPYFVDIYLGEFHLGIEINSRFHISKNRDKLREKYLLDTYNLFLIHIDIKEIDNKNKNILIQKIKDFIINDKNTEEDLRSKFIKEL